MANKRDSNSQKRARENRARRQALEARTKGAPPARPSRVAPSTAEKLQRSAEQRSAPASSEATTEAGSKGGKGSSGTSDTKPRRERPPRPGNRPVDIETLEGSWFSKITMVPGGTQVLFAVVMAVAATGLMSFTHVFIAAEDLKDKRPKATQTVFEAKALPVALLLVALPLVVTGITLAMSLRPHRRRAWLGAAVVFGALGLAVHQLFLFAGGFMAWAVFRASRVEGPNEPLLGSLLSARRARRGGADEPAGPTVDDA